MLRDVMSAFPGTLRMAGPEWNTTVNYIRSTDCVYEHCSACTQRTPLQYLPVLATHWQVSPGQA